MQVANVTDETTETDTLSIPKKEFLELRNLGKVLINRDTVVGYPAGTELRAIQHYGSGEEILCILKRRWLRKSQLIKR
ncbi:MAG: hypothetical protein ACI9H6_000031 [Patiriisocius sp.]|jgi:hypothetical protein